MTNFKAIAAVAENGVIGRGLEIPWHISADFKHFKRTTTGGVVVMGRNTWESFKGRPLPNRENVVVSSRIKDVSGATVFGSLEAVAKAYENDLRDIWIIGGAKLYGAALPMCSELILSRVKMCPEGDVFFPPFESMFAPCETLLKEELFDVIRYVRI